MDKVFIDSSGYSSLYNRKDNFHLEAKSRALEIFGKKIPAVTSNYVIDETLTNLLARIGYKVALQFGKRIFEENHAIEIIRVDENLEKQAWQVFKKYNKDKNWSFTDCTSFVIMKSMGIKVAFTFDERDFRQMGFKVL